MQCFIALCSSNTFWFGKLGIFIRFHDFSSIIDMQHESRNITCMCHLLTDRAHCCLPCHCYPGSHTRQAAVLSWLRITNITHIWVTASCIWYIGNRYLDIFHSTDWQTPLSTGLLYPKLRAQTNGIIQKLYETKTNTNTGWFKSVYWLFSEIKPKMCDFARFHCFSSKNGLNCNMTFR